jgi:4-diphosphocytidyl-2-C-methyl-D-erythritol kinase
MLYRCYAKINLTLEIVGRRPDGYHELASLVHTISLADDLGVEPADQLQTRVEGQDLDPETNLVSRAAGLLAGRLQEMRGAKLTLVKHIPTAAGLGGGSSDAAATLAALSALWDARLSGKELRDLAAELGSDVPFFVRGGAALMRGRGDDLEDVPPRLDQWLVLLVPPHAIGDKTRRLYASLQRADLSSGEMTRRAAERLRAGEAFDENLLINAFSRAARTVFPGLEPLWHAAEDITGRRFFLSGAGPALFSLAANRAHANQLADRLGGFQAKAYTARMVEHAHASLRAAAIEYA